MRATGKKTDIGAGRKGERSGWESKFKFVRVFLLESWKAMLTSCYSLTYPFPFVSFTSSAFLSLSLFQCLNSKGLSFLRETPESTCRESWFNTLWSFIYPGPSDVGPGTGQPWWRSQSGLQ